MNAVAVVSRALRGMYYTVKSHLTVFALMVMGALTLTLPAAASATETETETKVHEIATNVGTEGVAIVLGILAALVALLVAVIIIPKAIALIRRFI